MTTTFPVDNRNILSEVDSTSGWTATDGPTLYTTEPTPIESTGCLSMQVSNSVESAYMSITSDDYSGGGSLSVWIQDRAEFELTANVGVGIVVGDGTNRIAYAVGGSDGTAFRHDVGPVKWANFLLDLANKPTDFVAIAGSEANLDESAITQVGVYFETTVKSVGGADNVFWDVIRWADNGDDVVMQGGTTSGAAGNAAEAAAVDRSIGDQQAYGVIRELGAGVYGIQGNLTIGNSASASDQYWEEVNATYAWEDRGLSANNYYRFKLIGSGTANNCEIDFQQCSFNIPAAASAHFDGDGANLTHCHLLSCTLIGFDQGVETNSGTSEDWSSTSYISCGQVVYNGCDITRSIISESEVGSNVGTLLYDIAADTDGKLDNITFVKGSNANHAIDFGTNVSSALTKITLKGCEFSGWSGSEDDQNDSTVRFLATSGSLELSMVDCTCDGNPVRTFGIGKNFSWHDTAGMTITVTTTQVPLRVTVVDATTGSALPNARIYLHKDGDTSTVYFEDEADVNGEVNDSIIFIGDTDVVGWAREMDVSGTDYHPKDIVGTITSAGLDILVALEPIT